MIWIFISIYVQFQNTLLCWTQKLYNIGARKVLITSAGPLGCLPYEMWQMGIKNGECSDEVNKWVQIYNEKLLLFIQDMPQQIPDLYLLYGNAFDKVYAYIQTPHEYGILSIHS